MLADRGGALLPALQEVFPDQDPLDRTWINAWEDPAVVDWAMVDEHESAVVRRQKLEAARSGRISSGQGVAS